MNMRLLVVEPDQAVRDELRSHFHREHVEMSVLYSATFLVRRVEQEMPCVIVVRAELPLSEAHTALRSLRAAGHDLPVIMISKSSDVIDKIVAFELGADDYLVEPFDPRELTARIRSVMRRRTSIVYAAPEIRDRYSFGDWQIDFATRRLIKDDEDVGLRSSEFALLKIFAVNPLKLMSREHHRLAWHARYGPDGAWSRRIGVSSAFAHRTARWESTIYSDSARPRLYVCALRRGERCRRLSRNALGPRQAAAHAGQHEPHADGPGVGSTLVRLAG
jgi:DNA-binding response OmpR family regulator